ncbi:MAG TPA: adenylyltransferase/cytidyltransferase family protein [Kofleriaceae bacterium]|jgi:glycerol-3-phosphate cytidylyltransferase|nr:adenylyltransferase/cytidyltransferase family protein [Kofleriaceae bacterium]
MKRVMTCGTFDLFHIGHLRLLERARALGDGLVVRVSTDEFSALKGKEPVQSYGERAAIIAALRCVDFVRPEEHWDKPAYIREDAISIFTIGDDWSGHFDALSSFCEVVYLTRTPDVSTTKRLTDIRRRHGRVRISLPCRLEANGIAFWGTLVNLSISGASINFEHTAPASASEEAFALTLASIPELGLACRVVRQEGLTCAVEFVEPTGPQLLALEELRAKHAVEG